MKEPAFMKDKILDEIKVYFYEERGEELGDLAAENMYAWLSEQIAPYYYNQGVHDARQIVEQKVVNLDEDISSLERPLR
ncbi:DUF2164 domain-containing protein [Alkalibacillus almallahensis]|uniref:DUF2164 domain-containing protein n=1 Tax=Alkalibacillus almallahensis TaxID=1379154 RepID=UPI001421B989|nr:DUF2164 domain-containing protein [Alkalibacillus almallahensis]NIK13333.1 uncharacterized protein (DUF2164 family) [Alkalibacillus almallahensis]